MDKLPKNGSMKIDKFTCTKTSLGRHFQMTSQTHVFNTWSIFFCSHYGKILFFLFLADWYFAYETIIRQPEGMVGYSVHQGTWLCYLTNFIIEITPPCGNFKLPFQFPESNFPVFLKCKIIFFLLLADLYLCRKTLHGVTEAMVRCTHQQAIA